jgi:hypothetical protein
VLVAIVVVIALYVIGAIVFGGGGQEPGPA